MRTSQTNLPAGLVRLHPQAPESLSVTELMLDTSTNFAWAVDAETFGLLWFNRRIREHFLEHRSIHAAVGMRPRDLFGDSAACTEWLGLFHRALRDGPFSVDYAMHFGGRKLLLTISPMLRNGQLVGISVFGQDNTEGLQLRESLRESEEKFRVAFMTSLDAFYLASLEGGKIVEVNGVFEEVFGYTRAEVVGKSSLELGLFASPNDRSRTVRELRENGYFRDWELKGVRKGGKLLDLSVSQQVVVLGAVPHVVGTVRDIGHRRDAEVALERIRVGFEQGAVGQALATLQGGVLQVNAAFARMLGYEPRDLSGRALVDVIHPDDRDHAWQSMERLSSGAATCRCDIRYVTSSGAVIWVDGSVALVRDNAGQPLYFVCTFVDMTGHKIAEDERARFEAQWKKTMEGTTLTLSMALEIRDPHTAGHQRRVADLACAIWDRLGLPQERREGLRVAALLHDLGKLAIPADILSKPSKLNAIERALVQQHCMAGWDVLRLVEFPWPIATMVRQHHERQDGSGYPDGLRGEEILMESSVLAVADVVEAMASHRPYRAAIATAKVLEELAQGRGKLYRPEVVDACLQVFSEGYVLPS